MVARHGVTGNHRRSSHLQSRKGLSRQGEPISSDALRSAIGPQRPGSVEVLLWRGFGIARTRDHLVYAGPCLASQLNLSNRCRPAATPPIVAPFHLRAPRSAELPPRSWNQPRPRSLREERDTRRMTDLRFRLFMRWRLRSICVTCSA
jgi:hypothetical protein